MKNALILTFIIYCLIATFFYVNILFNPRFNLILIHKKTGQEKQPSISFIAFFCLLWIIYIPLSIITEIIRRQK